MNISLIDLYNITISNKNHEFRFVKWLHFFFNVLKFNVKIYGFLYFVNCQYV